MKIYVVSLIKELCYKCTGSEFAESTTDADIRKVQNMSDPLNF